MPKQYRKVTEFVVCGSMGLALFFLIFNVAPWYIAGALAFYLAFEMWTIINNRPGDTISDIVWNISDERPIVSWLFGGAGAGMIALGWFGPDWKAAVLCAAWFFVNGHFFFPRYGAKTGDKA